MQTVGIGDLQKNTSIFANLNQPLKIVDKRKKEELAVVYPMKKKSVISALAGKYKDVVQKSNLSFQEIKEKAFTEAMREKYGLSS